MRRPPVGRAAAWVCWLWLVSAPGCAELPVIPAAECGNGVVEAGEDCDSIAGGGLVCGEPGQRAACRYTCGSEAGCPAGWGCGQDGLCRAPSGAFEKRGAALEMGDVQPALADVDGDGRSDLLTTSTPNLLGNRSVRLSFLGDDGAIEQQIIQPAQLGAPTLSDLTLDGKTDLLFGYNAGIAVMQGDSSRSFPPLSYPTFSVPDTSGETQIRASAVRFRGEAPLSRVMVLLRTTDGQNLLIRDNRNDRKNTTECALNSHASLSSEVLALLEPDESIDNLLSFASGGMAEALPGAASCPGGGFDPDALAALSDRVAFAFRGRADVLVFSPSNRDPTNEYRWNQLQPPLADPTDYVPATRVKLAGGMRPAGSLVWARFDCDPWFDLVIGTDAGPFVAYGRPDGSFSSEPGGGGAPDTAAPLPLPLPCDIKAGDCQFLNPHAVADLNQDGQPDFILPAFLLESAPGTKNYAVTFQKLPGLWSEAKVADFNGDGIPDVVGVSRGTPNVEFLAGTGLGLYNVTSLPTTESPSLLTVGDLDGDGLPDLIFREAPPNAVAGAMPQPDYAGDVLSVAFGQRGQPPTAPVPIGRFERIQHIIASVLGEPASTSLDTLADIGVASAPLSGGSTSISILFGNTSRQLLSPYGLTDPRCGLRALSLGQVTGHFVPSSGASPTPLDLVSVAIELPQQSGGSQDGDTLDLEPNKNVRIWTLAANSPKSFQTPLLSPELPTEAYFLRTERELREQLAATGSILEVFAQTGAHFGAQLAAGDIDRAADGLDEVVIAMPYATSEGELNSRGALMVARSTLLPAEVGEVGGPYYYLTVDASRTVLFDRPVLRNARTELADMDGDGHLDLLLLSAGFAGASELLVFWNDGSGGFSAPQAVAGVTSPRGFATINADGDTRRDVIAVGEEAAWIIRSPAGSPRQLAAAPLPAAMGGRAVSVGEIDGDGVEDVVVARNNQLNVFFGTPTIR